MDDDIYAQMCNLINRLDLESPRATRLEVSPDVLVWLALEYPPAGLPLPYTARASLVVGVPIHVMDDFTEGQWRLFDQFGNVMDESE